MPRRRIVDWGGSMISGAIAGGISLGLVMIIVGIVGGSPWTPPRMIASIIMGPQVIESTGFAPNIIGLALVVHFVISGVLAATLWFLIRKRTIIPAVCIGAGFGLGIYGIIFYGLTVTYPWLVGGRNLATIIGYLVFGVVAAWIHHRLSVRDLLATKAMPATIRHEAKDTVE